MENLQLDDLFDARIQAEYFNNLDPNMREAYLGPSLFPVQKIPGLELSWIKGYNDYSVSLQPAAYDAQAPYRDRHGIAKMLTELPFFRERMRIGEKERAQLRNVSAKGLAIANSLIQKIYDDHLQLINGAHVVMEDMRMQLLQDASIKIVSGDETGQGIVYEYNFDPQNVWHTHNMRTLTSAQQWDSSNAANSKPLEDILSFQIFLKKQLGVNAARLIMNYQTFLNMIASQSITKAMNPVGYANMFITPQKAQAFIIDQLGLQIIIYDKAFKNTNKEIVKYVNDNIVIFLPAGPVGKTNMGVTPEIGDLLAGATPAGVSVAEVDTGIALTTRKIVHPVNMETIVSMVGLPSFEGIDQVAILKVQP